MQWLVRLCILILEIMFAVGAVGSILVLVLAAISEAEGALGDESEQVD